jgi:hypothetical protein
MKVKHLVDELATLRLEGKRRKAREKKILLLLEDKLSEGKTIKGNDYSIVLSHEFYRSFSAELAKELLTSKQIKQCTVEATRQRVLVSKRK